MIAAAIDYRGDVTITRRSTGESIEGYLFARTEPDDRGGAALRLLPASGGAAATVPFTDVARIELTGRDTAEGKSFEKWLERYVERKLAGEPANLE